MKRKLSFGRAFELKRIQKRIRLQIGVAISSFLLLIVLVFSMTTAWYTNTAKTGTLTFETKSWGFDEKKIQVGMDILDESPMLRVNASGYVPISIDNSDGEDAIRIRVNAAKNKMPIELQKRIYFYADESRQYTFGTEDEEETVETVHPVYLDGDELFQTYYLPAGQLLTLNEDFCSDSPIRWKWVNDMQGYYFRGTVVKNGTVSVEDYLRPIEYDRDDATWYSEETGADKIGQLESVAEKNVAQFLLELTENDGYPGKIILPPDPEDEESIPATEEEPQEYTKAVVISADEEDPSGLPVGDHYYYPVAVDEEGHGVWAYLCTLSEVDAGIAFDTAFAEDPTQFISESVHTNITIGVTSIKREEPVSAATAEDLAAAIEKSAGVIELANDIVIEDGFSIEKGENEQKRSCLIDLNGYALTLKAVNTSKTAFSVGEGTSLTLQNGRLFRENTGAQTASTGTIDTVAVDAINGSVVMGGMTLKGFDCAVRVHDMDGEGAGNSTVRITNCTLESKEATIFIQGDGSRSENVHTRLILQRSRIVSDYIGISGNGTSSSDDERWGTELIISDCEISGTWAAIYHPQQNSIATVTDSTLTGYTGVAVKGGTIRIKNCTVNGTGEHQEAAVSNSGWTDTGDGIYLEAVYGWGATVKLEGEKNTVNSVNGYAVQLFGKTGTLGSVTVMDGTYTGGLGSFQWNDVGTFTINGGTYDNAEDEIDIVIPGT